MTFPRPLMERAASIQLFVSDIDGCWTDGRLLVHPDGSECVLFSIHDGYGVVRAQELGLEIAIISGRDNPAVMHRASKLGVKEVHLGVREKGPLIQKLIADRGLRQEQVAALGDDLPDLDMFQQAELCIAPPSAVSAVRERADWVTRAAAGQGALREACDLFIAAREGALGS